MTKRLKALLALLAKTRGYTEEMIRNVRPEDWFRQPAEGVTHVAWQIGHLAVAEYALTMKRIRGARPEDAELLPEEFSRWFGKGSEPTVDASQYPPPEQIRLVFHGVHQTAMAELGSLADHVLDEPVDPVHPMFSTKWEALQFCVQHEMLHVGQIALLRRLFGYDWLR